MKKLVVLSALFAAVLITGCGTATRCQTINARDCVINVLNNDPESMSENAYPRSLNILSQDQMVEGGSDTIASGNATPIAPLSGDKALDTLGTVGAAAYAPGLGSAASAIKKAVTSDKAAPAAAATCPDNNCAPAAK